MTVKEFIAAFNQRHGRLPKIGFVGLGSSNLALAGEALAGGCQITARSDSPTNALPEATERYIGDTALSCIGEDVLFLSPSVRRDRRELIEAAERGVLLSSDCELFFEGFDTECFLVTGSDGKSTVSTLISRMISSHSEIYLGGNIGVPLCRLPKSADAAYVVELSSFNLMYMKPHSTRCVITRIAENHLDWHKSFDEYIRAKVNILEGSGGAVLSADDPVCRKIAENVPVFALFSLRSISSELMRSINAHHYLTLSEGDILLDGEAVISTSELGRREPYNIANFMAAIGATVGYTDTEKIRSVCQGFVGLEHRAKLCHNGCGVDFIDSSIDTTPERTRATLEGLDRSVRLILGGRGKGLSPLPMRDAILKHAERIGIYGEVGRELMDFIESDTALRQIPHDSFRTLTEAIDYAAQNVSCADTVLLSPAATAYGEFKSYKERGLRFKEYVKSKYR